MDINALPVATQLPVPPSARCVGGDGPVQVKKVAQDFEAMFVGMMLKSMRDTVGKDKLTGGGHGEETFRPMLDQEYAQAAARNGGLGLATMIEQQMKRTASPAPPPLKGNRDAD